MRLGRWPLAWCAVAASCGGGDQEVTYDWRDDDRLRVVLAGGPRSGHFDSDTSDMLAVMVQKLATGQRDVQNHYRGELAQGGPRCVSLIDDLIQQHSTSRAGTLVVGNAIGVLGLCEDPEAVVAVRKMLGHPAENVRSAAIRAMARLSEAGDYDVLESLMPTVNGELRRVLVQAMGHADPHRLGGDLSQWVESRGETALSVIAARAVAEEGAGAGLQADILTREAAQDVNLLPFLAGARAASGDAHAREELQALLESEDLLVRTRALEAAALSGLEELLMDLVIGDPSENLRVLSAEAVSRLLPEDRAREALIAGTRDGAPSVRQACLRGLLHVGDPVAADQFIALLRAGGGELTSCLRAVRQQWDQNPGLADRAARTLIDELDARRGRPVSEREIWIQALGQVPSLEASSWILELARSESGVSHRLSTHRWLVLQLSNGGLIGRSTLVQAWREEEDPERRMDYLWGASLSREEDTRTFLLEVAQDVSVPEHERLFAAECLTRLGPTMHVAPLLKRACLNITDRDVRPAFQGLLWTWYG